MIDRARRAIIVGMFGGLAGAAAFTPAAAQSIPIVPPIGPAFAGCVLAGNLGPCIAAAATLPPIIVIPGFGGNGGGNVDVDKDVDRSRERGRVVIS